MMDYRNGGTFNGLIGQEMMFQPRPENRRSEMEMSPEKALTDPEGHETISEYGQEIGTCDGLPKGSVGARRDIRHEIERMRYNSEADPAD